MTSNKTTGSHVHLPNPLDVISTILDNEDLEYARLSETELLLEIEGDKTSHRLIVTWDDEMHAVLFMNFMMDLVPCEPTMPELYHFLNMMNTVAYLGTFIYMEEENSLVMRELVMMPEEGVISSEQLSNQLFTMLDQCEFYFDSFESVISGEKTALEADVSPLLSVAGEA